MTLKNKKIVITGGEGFLGKYVYSELLKIGVPKKNIFVPTHQDYDLTKWDNCKKIVIKKDIVIHLAAKVGGIGLNNEKPGELFYDNLIMGAQLMEASRLAGVKKFIALGTICAYPKIVSTPFKEKDLWNGYPEETNAPYGLAKKMMLVQAQSYRKQYGFNAIYLLPVNIYGPGDNFNPKSSHVIPAIIKKIHEAKEKNIDFIEVWGTGASTREFLYVEDAARGIILATQKYEKSDPVNLGSGQDISIKNLVNLICELMEFKGKIKWDKTKPDGQPKRLLDISKAKKEFGFRAKTPFKDGLTNTINWYLKH